MAKTNLAQSVEATNDIGAAYDANIKYLLADKQVLARILKYAVEEFHDMPLNEIMANIGDNIEIGSKSLVPGLTNLGRVQLSSAEDNVPGEGKIYFDIRFSAYNRTDEMKFLINVEAQRASSAKKLGYHLENRIVFYLARMISAQKQTEFYHSDYDNLKKVRSIWICMDGKADGDSIEELVLDRKTIFGKASDSYRVDLLRGIIIKVRIRENVAESKNILISMLENLLTKTEINEKQRILTEKYGMVMTTELEGRIHTMCNWSEGIKEMAMEQGLEQGIARGIQALIETCREFQASWEETLHKVETKFDLPEDDARGYMEVYWK